MRGSPAILIGSVESRMDSSLFDTSHSRFLQAAMTASRRKDARGADVIDYAAHRERVNRRRFDAAATEAGMKTDGFSTSGGYYMARELEHIYEEVLQEVVALPTAWNLFTLDETVPVGATSYTIRREYAYGEARVWRGPGDEVPRVGSQRREENQPVRHLVSGFGWDFFEALSDKYANRNRVADDLRISRDVIMSKANQIWWQGAPQHGLYGILNYPWLMKKEVSQGFLRATVAASPGAVLAVLHDLANYPHTASNSAFDPDTMITTNRVLDAMSSTPLSAGSDTTVLEHFMKNTKVIKKVEVAWELADAGGTGIDGILFCRTDQRGIRPVLVQGVTPLPAQEKGLESLQIQYASIGGIRIVDPLAQLLALVNVTV